MKCDQCADLRRARAALISQAIDLQNAEVELRVARRRISALQAAAERDRQDDEMKTEALEVFHYWRKTVRPKARAFDGKRLQAVLDRLHNGYTVTDLKEAVDGAKADPYVNPKGVRFDDLELVCRDPVNTDRFMDRAARGPARSSDPAILRSALRDGLTELWGVPIGHSLDSSWEMWPCPACSVDPPTHRALKVAPLTRDPWLWCDDCETTVSLMLKRLGRRLAGEQP